MKKYSYQSQDVCKRYRQREADILQAPKNEEGHQTQVESCKVQHGDRRPAIYMRMKVEGVSLYNPRIEQTYIDQSYNRLPTVWYDDLVRDKVWVVAVHRYGNL